MPSAAPTSPLREASGIESLLHHPRALALAASLAITGCSPAATAPAQTPAPVPAAAGGSTLAIGLVSPEPLEKIAAYQPLADYLAANLTASGVARGEVVLTRDIETMGQNLRDGSVHVFVGSASSTLRLEETAGAQPVALATKGGDTDYRTLFIARKDSGITAVSALSGELVAFERDISTSGFLLPAAELVEAGFSLKQIQSGSAPPRSRAAEVQYLFTRRAANTVDAVIHRQAAAGAMSNTNFAKLDPKVQADLVTFGHGRLIPRSLVSLVSLGPKRAPAVAAQVPGLLNRLADAVDDKAILAAADGTANFQPLSKATEESLAFIRDVIRRTVGDLSS
ncbi:MAG: hypothetical protein EXR52_05115 [Dehalococcoidia bacterium]|nr:hypothetical protein [Dehalococcoidia bacterium]